MKALPTQWSGTVFRSRTEARWAVFFDVLGIRWEYEAQGFELSDGSRYLPDFWLPDFGLWCEVKGTDPAYRDWSRIEQLVLEGDHAFLILEGAPWPQWYRRLFRETHGEESRCMADWACWVERYAKREHRLYCSYGGPDQPPAADIPEDPAIEEAMRYARAVNLSEAA